MPLVTISLVGKRDRAQKARVLDAAHVALVSAGVPEADRFQRVVELDPDNVRYDPRYPDLAVDRNADFALVEVLWSVGRSVKVKRPFVAAMADGVASALGVDRERVMVVILETQWENWSFGGGRLLHA